MGHDYVSTTYNRPYNVPGGTADQLSQLTRSTSLATGTSLIGPYMCTSASKEEPNTLGR